MKKYIIGATVFSFIFISSQCLAVSVSPLVGNPKAEIGAVGQWIGDPVNVAQQDTYKMIRECYTTISPNYNTNENPSVFIPCDKESMDVNILEPYLVSKNLFVTADGKLSVGDPVITVPKTTVTSKAPTLSAPPTPSVVQAVSPTVTTPSVDQNTDLENRVTALEVKTKYSDFWLAFDYAGTLVIAAVLVWLATRRK